MARDRRQVRCTVCSISADYVIPVNAQTQKGCSLGSIWKNQMSKRDLPEHERLTLLSAWWCTMDGVLS